MTSAFGELPDRTDHLLRSTLQQGQLQHRLKLSALVALHSSHVCLGVHARIYRRKSRISVRYLLALRNRFQIDIQCASSAARGFA
ncbi:MAG: hypothetical protein ABI627_29460 [Polyangiaceae bacterium]